MQQSVHPHVQSWSGGGGGRVYPVEADECAMSSGSGKTWEESCSGGKRGDETGSLIPVTDGSPRGLTALWENAETPIVSPDKPLLVSHFVRVRPHNPASLPAF